MKWRKGTDLPNKDCMCICITRRKRHDNDFDFVPNLKLRHYIHEKDKNKKFPWGFQVETVEYWAKIDNIPRDIIHRELISCFPY